MPKLEFPALLPLSDADAEMYWLTYCAKFHKSDTPRNRRRFLARRSIGAYDERGRLRGAVQLDSGQELTRVKTYVVAAGALLLCVVAINLIAGPTHRLGAVWLPLRVLDVGVLCPAVVFFNSVTPYRRYLFKSPSTAPTLVFNLVSIPHDDVAPNASWFAFVTRLWPTACNSTLPRSLMLVPLNRRLERRYAVLAKWCARGGVDLIVLKPFSLVRALHRRTSDVVA